ncbi:MAG: DUF6089 family protein [Bacteroidota bacterium]
MRIPFRLFVILFLITAAKTISAQKVDVGLLLGGSYYYGDVVNEVEPTTIRPAFGAFVRYRLTDRLALKAFGGYAVVSGDDQLSESTWQQQRNWSFESTIIEGSLQAEFNLLEDRNRGRRFANPFIPYLFLGVGGFYFQPKSEFNGTLQSTAELQLSGVAYSQTAIAVPMGIGFRYYVSHKIQLGFEFGMRYTTTSYIDDIGGSDVYVDPSTTPFPDVTRYYYARSVANNNPGDLRGKMGLAALKVNDIYFIYGLTASYTLGKTKGGAGGSRGGKPSGKAIRCPRFY